MNLKKRLALMLAVLIGLMAASGWIALDRIRDVAASIDTVHRDRIIPIQQLREVSDGYLVHISQAVLKAQRKRISVADALRKIDAAERHIHVQWQAYKLTYLITPEIELIDEAEPLLSQADAATARVRTLLAEGNLADAAAFGDNEMMPVFERLSGVLGRLVDVQMDAARRASALGQQTYARAILVSVALTLVASGIGGMLAWLVLARYLAESKEAEHRTRRLHGFFRVLAQTNQLIVRERDAAALYEKVCRICVDTGQALSAAIVEVEGKFAKRTVTAGPAPDTWNAFPACWDVSSPEGKRLLSTQAVLSGKHVISQDFLADSMAAGIELNRHGIRALAAFPFRKAGVVGGALVISAGQVGYFDQHLIDLLDEMAEDLSFGLENIEREQARVAAVQAMHDREQQLAGILESAMDAIITIDDQHRIVVFNLAAAAMFGVAAEQAMGQTMDRFIPEAAREAHRKHLDSFALGGTTSRAMGEHRRLTGVRADGSQFPIEVSISRTGSSGRGLMTAVIRDMSDVVEAERARQAQAEAEAASKAKTEFLSRMSHELRTPLNAVLGFSELVRATAGERLTSQELAQLEHVRKAGWHLLTLINDVLDVSSIESGRVQIESRSLAMQPVLDEAVRMVEALAHESQVRLETSCRLPATVGVMADPLRLRQVLINLLSNAVKYNRQGGRVGVEVSTDGSLVRIDIADTGLGMSKEQSEHLFEPFNRLGRERGGIEGSGIGLALTRELVRLMKGQMDVESVLGRGTRVRLALPASRTLGQDQRPTGGPEEAQEPSPVGVVLYIEDNPVNMLLVEHMLASWSGVRLVKAEDGGSGIELARSLLPDLVLLDMQLPDMHGIDVLQALRADAATRHLRVVALSASAMPEDVERALRFGAADYWTKPLDFKRFLRDLRRLLPAEAVPS